MKLEDFIYSTPNHQMKSHKKEAGDEPALLLFQITYRLFHFL